MGLAQQRGQRMNKSNSLALVAAAALSIPSLVAQAAELHVATNGNDANRGTKSAPFRTIQHAAELAQPGDTIIVRAGTYREWVNPPRGGTSDQQRIVYQAARGEKVQIKGSELIKNWVKIQEGVWKVILPDSFFGKFNPYNDLIHGDWFEPRGRPHHTGAVYLNGEWLIEAAKLEEVLAQPGTVPAWLSQGGGQYLLNVSWLRPGKDRGEAGRVPADKFAAHKGVQTAACSEGGQCIGWIEHGSWVRYDGVDFGQSTDNMEIRAASPGEGGLIEVRLDKPEGELLGICRVRNTGDWQSWATFNARLTKAVSGVKTVCLVFKARQSETRTLDAPLWFAQVDGANTTIWAQFKDVDPNREQVEINVRQAVFYPDRPGRNYITVRGFTLRDAATPWAPPTAKQVGLIGTHWSKGWIIENNTVSHSVCSGIALGKYGDQYDNTSANTAEGYVKTIERGLQNGWNRDTIGHHIVRNNTISHCEQTGVVGSLGAAFCTVTGNTIHDIHVRRLFTGAEMAGIKFHAAIDTVIQGNHIYRTCLGLWLDWMAQGTRVSGNLFHDNLGQDLFVEVDHGPFLVDNNLFLSGTSLLDMSEGGAYVHNLLSGKIVSNPEPNRETPYHPAHTTTVAGLVTIKGGDDRFYNNIFVGGGDNAAGFGLSMYDKREYPLHTGGNVFYKGAKPYANEAGGATAAGDPQAKLVLENGRATFQFTPGPEFKKAATQLVTTELLGKAKIPGVAYENPDGSPLKINTDFFGKKRSQKNPSPGPFESPGPGPIILTLR
jgi:alpha-L-arabinofuranosidase